MSIRLMDAVWNGAPYKGTDLLLLLALADYANDAGLCWPTLKTLSKKARLDDCRSMRRHLDKFLADGILLRMRRPGTSTLTQLLIPASWYFVPSPGHDPSPGDGYPQGYPHEGVSQPQGVSQPPSQGVSQPPQGVSQPPSQGAAQPPDPSSADPSLEPSGDPSPRSLPAARSEPAPLKITREEYLRRREAAQRTEQERLYGKAVGQ